MIIRKRVHPNARLSDDIGIWQGFIVYEVLYLVFEVEATGFMGKFLMEVIILIEVPSRWYEIRHRCGI